MSENRLHILPTEKIFAAFRRAIVYFSLKKTCPVQPGYKVNPPSPVCHHALRFA